MIDEDVLYLLDRSGTVTRVADAESADVLVGYRDGVAWVADNAIHTIAAAGAEVRELWRSEHMLQELVELDDRLLVIEDEASDPLASALGRPGPRSVLALSGR